MPSETDPPSPYPQCPQPEEPECPDPEEWECPESEDGSPPSGRSLDRTRSIWQMEHFPGSDFLYEGCIGQTHSSATGGL